MEGDFSSRFLTPSTRVRNWATALGRATCRDILYLGALTLGQKFVDTRRTKEVIALASFVGIRVKFNVEMQQAGGYRHAISQQGKNFIWCFREGLL